MTDRLNVLGIVDTYTDEIDPDGNLFNKQESSGDPNVDAAVTKYNEALAAFRKNPEDPEKAAILGEMAVAAMETISNSAISSDLKENLNTQFKESLGDEKHSSRSFFGKDFTVSTNSNEQAIDAILDDAIGALNGLHTIVHTNSELSVSALQAIETLDTAREVHQSGQHPNKDATLASYEYALANAIEQLESLSPRLPKGGEGAEYISNLLTNLHKEREQLDNSKAS